MAKTRDEGSTETQLLPVMNIMLLLIPALLLAMEVARMGAIEVRPPIPIQRLREPRHGYPFWSQTSRSFRPRAKPWDRR